MESLLTGYHSPSFLNVMQRRLTSRLYTFVLSLVRERGVAQWWKQSSPVNVVCVHIPQLMPEWMPLVGQVCCCMVLFIALGNFSTGTYNKFHNPTTSRKAAISNVYCHFNLKHTINTCEKILRAPAAKLVLIIKANLYLVVNLYLSSLVLKYYQLIFIVLNGQTVKQSVGHSPKLTS